MFSRLESSVRLHLPQTIATPEMLGSRSLARISPEHTVPTFAYITGLFRAAGAVPWVVKHRAVAHGTNSPGEEYILGESAQELSVLVEGWRILENDPHQVLSMMSTLGYRYETGQHESFLFVDLDGDLDDRRLHRTSQALCTAGFSGVIAYSGASGHYISDFTIPTDRAQKFYSKLIEILTPDESPHYHTCREIAQVFKEETTSLKELRNIARRILYDASHPLHIPSDSTGFRCESDVDVRYICHGFERDNFSYPSWGLRVTSKPDRPTPTVIAYLASAKSS